MFVVWASIRVVVMWQVTRTNSPFFTSFFVCSMECQNEILETDMSNTMLLAYSLFLVLLWLGGWSLKLSGSAKHAVLFTPNNLRVHDNVCLKYIEKDNQNQYIPVYINDSNLPSDTDVVSCLKSNLFKIGGELKCIDMDLAEAVDALVDAGIEHIVTSACHIDPFAARCKGFNNKMKKLGVKVTTLEDNLGIKLGKTECFDSALYNHKHKMPPQMAYDIVFNNNLSCASVSLWNGDALNNQNELAGEDLALKLVSDYVALGERSFTLKYQDQYASTITQSEDHMQSVRRLAGSERRRSAYFPGEVVSGLLAPLITMGCVSPRVLQGSQRASFPGVLVPDRWRGSVLQQEGIRHDWHNHLARMFTSKHPGHRNAENVTQPHWKLSFTPWRGYIQRQAVMHNDAAVSKHDNHSAELPSATLPTPKPVLLLLHGFGGSITQYTSLAQALSGQFEVHGIDSLGFGQSEKPPISYNQYLWRDQALEYLQGMARSRGNGTMSFTVAGNSIGGFTAASVAAAIGNTSHASAQSSLHCDGLILFNSAGVIVNNTDNTTVRYVPETAPEFPAYSGPPQALLRAFGAGLTAGLRSRVTPTCRWLYPTKPDYVTSSGLVDNITRDSFDPGASDVFAAGGKLPKPLTMNALLDVYKGPVLVAQGALDPLNDAVGRAIAFGNIRPNITVNLLQLGHCPMDEGAVEVAECVKKWAIGSGILSAA